MVGSVCTALLLVVPAGCSDEGATVALPTQDGPAQTSRLPVLETDTVKETYIQSVALLDRADALPENTHRQQLSRYLTDPRPSRVLERIEETGADGLASHGSPIPHITDVRINGDKATVYDCQDTSGSGLMKAATQEKVNRGVKEEHIKTFMLKSPDGLWRVRKYVVPGEGC